MLSDREIADLWSWAAAQDQGQETTQQHAFARAVERAAYERAAQECDRAFRKEWQREPLSDDDINKLAWKQNLWTDHMIEFSFLAFAREVERAHGIGGSDE